MVIGGGLLGLEAANGLRARGMKVSVVHLAGTLMERQLDQAAGDPLRPEPERRGLEVMTDANTEASSARPRSQACASRTGARSQRTWW